MEYSIKKLTENDFNLANELVKHWFRDEVSEIVKLPDKEHIENLLKSPQFHIYIALHNDEVVGGMTAYELTMFYKEEKEIFLYEIGINDGHRKKGIAKDLIDQLKEDCISEGIRVIFVMCEMENEAANQLYKSTGGDLKVISFYTYEL